MRKLLVVLSGGADSTICLAWAKQNAEEVHALTFDYGQRHAIEIESAQRVAQILGVASHEIVTLPKGVLKGSSPLVDPNGQVGHYGGVADLPGGVEPTFVPARNALFLVIAANRASVLGCHGIVIGVCEADYGGYPDCRSKFIESMSSAIHEGLYGDSAAQRHPVYAPLMSMNKRDSALLAAHLPKCLDALAFSHTSYDGDYPPNPFNHASLLRARGFHDAGMADPLIERAIREELLPQDYPVDGFVEGTRYGDPDTWLADVSNAKADGAPAAEESNEDPPPPPRRPRKPKVEDSPDVT